MTDRTLHRPPSTLPLFARAGASAIPGASRLPFIAGGGAEMPDTVLTLPGAVVDRDRLAAYDRVCGFPVSDALPATYPHVLAFGLHLALMTDGAFPLPAMGLVHIANRIVQHRAIDAGEPLTLRVWATPIVPHARGRQFMIRTEARAADELVWEEASTNLRRGRAPGEADDPGFETPDLPIPPAETLPTTATWRLGGDLGRRYGAVSGDLNPIHLHPLSARLLGFRSAIAHGMWTTARCLAALGPRLAPAFAVEVAFKRPILLPATVGFAEATTTGDGPAFAVRDAESGTPHLEGAVTTRYLP